MRDRFVSSPDVAEDFTARLFGDLGKVTESSPDNEVVVVARRVITRSFDKASKALLSNAQWKRLFIDTWLIHSSQITWLLALLTSMALRY